MEEYHITHYLNKNRWIIILAAMYSTFIFIFAPAGSLLYDNALYADIAKNFLQSGCFCSNFMVRPSTPPVFPLVVAGSMLLFGGLFIKALLAGIAFFGILVSYHFILKISRSRRIALLSTALFFLTPLVIYNSMLLLMDLLFGILVILSVWAYVVFLERKDRRWLVVFAAVTAIAIMTKMFGYVLIPIFMAHFVLERKRHKIPFRYLVLLLALIGLFLLPWNAWRYSLGVNEVNVGDELIFGGDYGHVLVRLESFYASGEPMNANPLVLDANVPFQVVNMARIAVSLLVYVTPLVSLYFLYYLSKSRKSGKRLKGKYDSLLIIWILAFLAFFTFGFFYFGSRYLIPMILPFVFFFARFLDSKIDKHKLMAASIIGLQMLSVAAVTYADSRLIWNKSQTEIFAQSGEWLKGNTAQDAVVLSLGAPEGALVYYGERKVISFNGSDYRTVPDYIVKSNFTQLIGIGEYEKMAGAKFDLVKSFSDRMYYSEIYKREM